MNLRRFSAVITIFGIVVLAASGCSPDAEPLPSPSGAPVISPTEIPETPPEFVPGGSAEENRAYFDYVVARHIVDGGIMNREGLAALLTSAGWEAAQVEVTPDATPLGNPADAHSFSVQLGKECLIGQWNGEYTSIVAPRLTSGTCLVGTPHPVS